MDASLTDPTLLKVEAFLKKTGMKPWRFGRDAAQDPKLVDQLRAGRELRRDTRDKIESFIAEQEAAKRTQAKAS